jgi:hypothetical protein
MTNRFSIPLTVAGSSTFAFYFFGFFYAADSTRGRIVTPVE